ncbi:MAG: NADP-dependent malic enzyme [Proteobacteria bacterium]|nr:NADP-dependent malic enzyme [Pseudomonadota bacterium]
MSTLELHENSKGKLETKSIFKINSKEILSQVYTPGVGEVCLKIKEDEKNLSKYTIAGKTVAVISNGTAVLGFGDIGPKAALPVMEGKAAIFNEFANINSYPICINEKDPEKFIQIVKSISLNFAAINLEDISAPNCFEIEKRLSEELDIPVIHDDQHGTAIVVLAALLGGVTLTNKKDLKISISGAGAAGTAITKLLLSAKEKNLVSISEIKVFDSNGLISTDRDNLNIYKLEIAKMTNQNAKCSFNEGVKNSDVFIGVSAPNSVTLENIQSMNKSPIVFALSNPVPEIMPEIAYKAGASIVATGRSDFPNQINNALAYPGVFKGLLKNQINKVTDELKIKAALAIYNYHKENLDFQNLLPSILDKKVPEIISNSF